MDGLGLADRLTSINQEEKEYVDEEAILMEIKRIREELPKLGCRKLQVKLSSFLQKQDIKMGRDALFSLLFRNGLLIRKRKNYHQTTMSRHWLCKYPNLIKDLNSKIKIMELEHKTVIAKLSLQLNKVFSYFPHIKDLLHWEPFLKNMRLPEDMIRRLFNKETVNGSGSLYSTEYRKSFKVENVSLKLEQDKEKT